MTSTIKSFVNTLTEQTAQMPVLFVGHGSPMNGIEDNEFSKRWRQMGKEIPKPAAVLCISAHWFTRGTHITAMQQPPTIHDFYGFPKELFDVEYPAPGQPQLAQETSTAIKKAHVGLDHEWGLDHGCWSVVRNMYPDADIPVVQLSIDATKPPQFHYELGNELSFLRTKGVLILGSGNIIHNLGMINWQMRETAYDWAQEMNEMFKHLIEDGNYQPLMNYETLGTSAKLSIPTPEHYLPLLYTLGLKKSGEQISFFNDKTLMGSISMMSVKISKV